MSSALQPAVRFEVLSIVHARRDLAKAATEFHRDRTGYRALKRPSGHAGARRARTRGSEI